MPRQSFASLRVRLLLLVILALVPASGFLVYSYVEERRIRAAQVKEAALQITRLAALEQERLIEGGRQFLLALARLPEVREGHAAACSALLADLRKRYHAYANLGVAALDGNAFCSALPLERPVSVADRAWFRRALAARGFAVGDYQVGRVTGRATLNFGYPVTDGAGQIRGVVFAALDLAWVGQVAAGARLPPGSSLTVVDRNGIILARHPDPQRWVGRAMSEIPVIRAIVTRQGEGTVEGEGVDGLPRLFAFAPLRGTAGTPEAYVATGIPLSWIYAESNRNLARNLASLIGVSVLALAALWAGGSLLVVRPVSALVDATRRLGKGDLGTRTDLPHAAGELGQLARAIDEMAQALQARDEQTRRAGRALLESEERYRTLVETSPDAIVVTDLDTNIIICNQQAVALARAESMGDLVGKNAFQFIAPEDHARAMEYARRTLETGSVRNVEYTLLRKDGSRYPAEMSASLLVNGDGQPRAFIGVVRDVTARKAAEERAQRQLQHLAGLRSIDMAITSSLDLRVTLKVFLDQVTSQLRVDAADVLLLNPQTQVLEYTADRGFRTAALQHAQLRVGEGLAGRAVMERRIISNLDLREVEVDEAFSRAPLLRDEGFVAYCAVPLIAKGHVRGVLEIFHRAPLHPDAEWARFLDALVGQAAIAIDNAVLFDNLQRANADLAVAYDTTLEGWSRALDLRDRATEGHTLRVTEITLRLARAMGMSDHEVVQVRRGALLHDMGKVGIPDAILHKPGPLTAEEWEIMRRHPMYARQLLSPIPYLTPALDIPYRHHEKWDGTGYPEGLRGEEIPLAARIFAVVDVWDALRSDRPYRPAWTDEAARQYIREQAGRHFDPRVAEAFLKLEGEMTRS
ncbi:MAG: PAS domain S-box protein [Armatimonadetes bacterium]|nr:PAS domain S-box protein [Armatimonadota bacterium]